LPALALTFPPHPPVAALRRLCAVTLVLLAALAVSLTVGPLVAGRAGVGTQPATHAAAHAAAGVPTGVPAALQSAVASSQGGAGLAETFADDGGLHVHEAGSTAAWSLVPVSLARSGAAAGALHGSAPVVRSGTTTYAMGPLDAWYRSGAAGIEQGFTVPTRPAGAGATVSVVLRSSGTLTQALAHGSLTLRTGAGTPAFHYGSLSVTDATGRVLPAHLALSGPTVRIVVDDAHAVYPLRIDPYTQQTTLLASDGTFNDYFGESVAISGDGKTAVVGADNKTVSGLAVAGQAYVYTESGTTWSQQQILAPTVPSLDAFFGISSALSADGNTAFIGAFGLKVGANFSQGGVYVFTRSGSTWTQRALLTASNGGQCYAFGSSMSVDAAGTELLVGAKGTGGCTAPEQIGAAYVFTGSAASWTQGVELTSGTGTADHFGSLAVLSADGSTALIGSPFAAGEDGAAYLFTGPNFATRTALSDPTAKAGDQFGLIGALSADGSTALVTAYTAESGSNFGLGYVYTGPGYTHRVVLETTLANGLGISAALTGDGSTAVLGNEDSTTTLAFEFSGPGYTSVAPIRTTTPQIGVGPYLGYALALTPDGTTFVTAGPGVTVGTNVDQGVAAIFQAATPTTPTTVGYWLAAADGAVKAYGGAVLYGSEAGAPLVKPVVGLTGSPDGKGYWLVGGDGGVFAFGDAGFHGSLSGAHLNAPIVGLVETPSGGGYWLVGADGGVFAFGNAGFHGSLAGTHLSAPIAGITATTDGGGYWLVGADGGVFAFGDAGFHGSLAGTPLSAAVVGIARTADNGGYWLVGANGSIHTLGDAVTHGSLVGTPLVKPVDDIVPTADGGGYALVAGDGGLFSFGDAPFYGSGVGAFPGSTVIGLAASNQV